jgi:hypothetical protein
MESRPFLEGIDIDSHSIKATDEPMSLPLTVERHIYECRALTNQDTVSFAAMKLMLPIDNIQSLFYAEELPAASFLSSLSRITGKPVLTRVR